MPITLSNAATRLSRYTNKLTTSGRVETADVAEFLNEFLRFSSREYLLPWAKRTTDLTIYDGIYRYSAPADMVVPIEPQRYISEDQNDDLNFHSTTQKEFARNLNNQNDFTVDWERDSDFLQIRHNLGLGSATIHNLNDFDTDDNGTITIAGDGSALAKDTGNFIQGSSSVAFTVTNSGNTVTIEGTGLTAVDLSDGYENASGFFLWLFLPVTGLTSVRLRVGNDASNFLVRTVTANFDGSAFRVGWNLLRFNWADATVTGTLTLTAFDYFQLLLTGGATGTRYRIDHLVARRARNILLPYYSNQLVLDDDGSTYKTELVDGEDSVIGNDEFVEAAVYAAGKSIAEYKLNDADLRAVFDAKLQPALRALRTRYPSQQMKISTSWFNQSLLRA